MDRHLYPLKFQPIYKDKIWGGARLKELLKKNGASNKCGESWEISCVEGDVSVVANGFLAGNNLKELVEVYMGELVGERVYEKFGDEFPLLVKFIDASNDLSIQVHPGDELARERHNAYGKTEMWYILDAATNASLMVGFKKDITKEEYVKSVTENKLLDIIKQENIKPGDVFFIPAGRVHAIGAGTLLAEIQQTSDVTYRIFDFNRIDDEGKPRELHTDLALDAIDFSGQPGSKITYTALKNRTSNLVDCAYFTTGMIKAGQRIDKDYNLIDSFIIYICVEGRVNIVYENGSEPLGKGETLLVPADLKMLSIIPEIPSRILEVYIK